ncbi:kinase-like domain-containing protein [Rhizophagus irregularis DAOM 181602=DAOM 197198]|nr:kinase-like domain-containing protein [Rhizophagus irregularis DAOM 181602=DAOM 197198]
MEWIEYDKFEDAEYLAKGGFGITFKAYLHNSQDITVDFLKEVESNILVRGYVDCIVPCFGFPPYHDITHDDFLAMKICQGLRPKCDYKIPQLVAVIINQFWDADPLKRPNADELCKLILELLHDIRDNKVDSIIYRQVKETDDINKKLSFSSPLISTGTLSYETHPQAVYTSRLLDFKNLPKPKNADNDDLEYSDSLRMDFTKLDINSKDKRN